mmetsp:Transcript_22652/g.27731  ORF Transcript_22652/g.27731 Transcript_22652/m.27731 type:complete len:248 (+) Transcript_22652:250-993(+)
MIEISLDSLNLEEEELKAARELEKRCPDANASQIVRFLRARNNKLDKAEAFLNKHLEWRRTYPLFNNNIDKAALETELAKNKCVYLGDAKDGTKTFICQLNLMGKHTYDDIEVSMSAMVAIFEYAESILEPLEKFSVAVTLKGYGWKHIDLPWARKMIPILQNQYPERLRSAYLAPVPFFIRGTWNGVIKPLLDPITKDKIHLGKNESLYLEALDVDLLPAIVGGTREKAPTNDVVIEHIMNTVYTK